MNIPVPIAQIPLYVWASSATIQCGFPSPAEDHAQKRLDLNELLIHQADATFFMRARGSSMRDAGIDDGDFVVVDRSIDPKHGCIVVAVVDGEFTVKQLYKKRGCVRLLAANPTYPNIDFKEGQELTIWGVVTWTVKSLLPA